MDISTLFTLLVLFQLKQFLADFCFQNHYMLQKERPGWDFVWPLSLHCSVHAIGTLLICLLFKPGLWWLFLVDFTVHFGMDRLRASPKMLGRYKDTKQAIYWQILGFDQMVHHFTHYGLIALILTT